MSETVYTPHKFQRLFHKSKARIRLVSTGRQTGKTFSGSVELLWHLQHGRSSCHKVLTKIVEGKYICSECGKPTEFNPIRALVVAPTYGDLDDINISMLKNLAPNIFDEGWNEQKKRLTLSNGSVCIFKSADKPDRLRGGTLDFLWLDEASFMRPETWEIVKPATLVKQATIIITTTPKGMDWVKGTFYDNASKVYTVKSPLEESRQAPIEIDKSGDNEIVAFHYRTYDVDHIPISDIQKEKDQMSERMFRQEYLATFETFSGLVYPMYDEKVHLIYDAPRIPMQYFVGIDVGWHNPTAMLLIGEDEHRNLYALNEVYESGLTIEQIAEKYKVLTAGKEIRETVIDPSTAGKTLASGGVSVLDQLRDVGVNAIIAPNDVQAGIARISQLLTPDRITDRPKLFIVRHCIHTRDEIQSYVYEESRNGVYSDKPKKQKDHLMDALKYVVLSRPDSYEHLPSRGYGARPIETGAIDMLSNRIDPDLF